MQKKLLLSVLVLCLSFFFGNALRAQSVSITFDYDGAQILGCCDVCGDDYICFGGGCGCCIGDGSFTFTDPVPPGNTISGVNVTFSGVDCGGGAASLSTTINGTPVGVSSGLNDCWCSNCYSYPPPVPTAFPCAGPGGFNYGGINTFAANAADIVCMNSVTITFDYVPNSSFALPPIGAITGPVSGCTGTTGTYNVPAVAGATSYTWTVPAGTIINSGQGTTSINVTYGATAGNICVTASSACDTEGPTCFPITVGSAATVNDPADQTLCAGASTAAVTFTGTGTTYNWTNTTTSIGLAASGSGNIASFVAVNATAAPVIATITVTPIAGCAGTPQTFTITVNPIPVVGAGPDQSICAGSPATLTATNPSGAAISWDNSVTNGSAFIPGATLTYTVTANLSGCTSTDQAVVTVNPLPSFSLSSTDPTVCAAADGTITISGLNASTNYNISYTDDGLGVGPTTMMSSGAGAIVITGLNAGSYANFQVSLAGCVGAVPTIITLTDPNPPTVGAGADQTVCAGTPVTLTAFNPGGAVITWDNAVSNGVAFTPASTLTYTVTANLAGCIATDQVIVTVNPIPIVGAGLDQTICAGAPVTLTATNPSAAALSWTLGVTNGVAFNPGSTNTYTVTATLLGCTSTDNVLVTVNALPTVTATAVPGTSPLCIGDNVTLNGGGASTYTWTGGVTNGVSFVATTTTSYTVTGTDVNGCVNTGNITLTVVNCALPIAAIGTSGSPSTICVNDCVNFQDLSTGTNIDTWSWNMGAGGVTSSVANPATMCYGVAGIYTITLTVTDDVGSDSETFTLTVIDCIPPTAEFTMSDSVICLGECITLTDLSLENPTEWEWAFDGAVSPNSSTLQNPTICPTTTGTFDIELTVTNPFGVDVISYPITVNVVPVVNAGLDTIIDMNTAVMLGAGVFPTGGDYTWTFGVGVDEDNDDIICPTCDSTYAYPVFTETYNLYYVTAEGCSATDQVLVTVLFEDLIAVPNGFSPNMDGNNEILFVKGEGIVDMQFVIYNRYGQKVFESFDQNIGWDGYLNNQPENPGVFVWYLDYTLIDGSRNSKKGNVTLLK